MTDKLLIIRDGEIVVDFDRYLNIYNRVSINEEQMDEVNLDEYRVVVVDGTSKDQRIEICNRVRAIKPEMALLIVEAYGSTESILDYKSIGGHGQMRMLYWRDGHELKLIGIINSLLHPELPTTKNDIAIVLPVFNEENRFHYVEHYILKLERLISESYPNMGIYIMNDGSWDRTSEMVQEVIDQKREKYPFISDTLFLNMRELKVNTRKAGTYIEAIKNIDAEMIVYSDADDSFEIEDISRMINIINDGYYDIVAATKDLTSENRPMVRRFMSCMKRMLTKPLLPKGVSDSQTGLKAISATAARHLLPYLKEERGLAIDLEIMFLAKNLKFRVYQLPVKCIDREGSHIDIIKDSIKYLKNIFMISIFDRIED